MLPPLRGRIGASMDMAKKEANEYYLSGKDALEKAGNMKKECKIEAMECLQGLGQIVLAVSDSRARYRTTMETKRVRAIREMRAMETKHNKELAKLRDVEGRQIEEIGSEMHQVRTTVTGIQKWLNFELGEPLRCLKAIHTKIMDKTVDSPRTTALVPVAGDRSRAGDPVWSNG